MIVPITADCIHIVANKAYKKKDDLVNLYMLINCMGRLLDEKNYKKFVKQVNSEINK